MYEGPADPNDDEVTTMTATIDPTFLSLPLRTLADAALTRARRLGAERADFRCERLRNLGMRLRDGRPLGMREDVDTGLAVRVVADGAWGFAAGVDLTPEGAARVAEAAVEVARVSRPLCTERVELADEPAYPDAAWVSNYARNPFDVPEADRWALLADWSARLLAAPGVDHAYAKFRATQENKFYADLAGSTIRQQRVRLYPQLTAIAVGSTDGAFVTMRSLGPPAARGWEYLEGDGWDWDAELRGCRSGSPRRRGAVRRGRQLRLGHRPDEPLADDPRISRARHRARPGARVRGILRGHLVRDPRLARLVAVRVAGHERHRGPDGPARPGHRRLRRRGCRGAVLGHHPRGRARGLPTRPPHGPARGIRPV